MTIAHVFRKVQVLTMCLLLTIVMFMSANPRMGRLRADAGTIIATTNNAQPLSNSQERATQGGSKACDFANGFGFGLAVAGLFGCVACGVIGLGVAAYSVVAC